MKTKLKFSESCRSMCRNHYYYGLNDVPNKKFSNNFDIRRWTTKRLVVLLFIIGTFFPSGLLIAQDGSSILDGIEVSKYFKAMRNSSTDLNWENGNADARPIPAGETLILAELTGPGRITHIWFTLTPFVKHYGKKLILKMYWDDEQYPSVEAPLNDFFCQGHGIDVDVHSLPFDVSRDGKARNCYFPMPFRESARIEITNEGDEDLRSCYWYIDWQKLNSLPENALYFHAKYRQEFPCQSEDGNYLILEAKGRGHFVGSNLSVRSLEPSWWGEGDDRFYVDGEEYPSLMGTGAEDYLCQAWGIREHNGLFYGCTLAERPATHPHVTCYRFHIPDPVPFSESLKVTIEHKGIRILPNGKGIYTVRSDDYSSVAYWYQAEPHFEFAPMPSLEDRLYSDNVVFIEGEMLGNSCEASGARPEIQVLPEASKGKFLHFSPLDGRASLNIKFSVPETATYDTWLHMEKSWNYGIYQIFLDGNAVNEPLDNYAANSIQAVSVNLGRLSLGEGEHILEFVCTGKNADSKGHSLGLDLIELMPVL